MDDVCFVHPSLSLHLQTAQDVSFANVQGLFQSLSSRRGCLTASQSDSEAEKASTQAEQKSASFNGKALQSSK